MKIFLNSIMLLIGISAIAGSVYLAAVSYQSAPFWMTITFFINMAIIYTINEEVKR